MHVTFDQIVAARSRIARGVYMTPCAESFSLSELCGCSVFTKLEHLQRTGSFKERGARNALLLLDDARRARGVIAASAGNHALALAFHGRDLGSPVTVVMPTIAPLIKQVRCRKLGARVILHGANIGEAKIHAQQIAAIDDLTYIHGYDAPEVIAGQGTIGLEVLDQVPDVDAVLVPVGGAGLIAGISLAVKTARPSTQVIGVVAEHAPSFAESMKAGKPIHVNPKPTLADGLAVPQVGAGALEIASRYVARVVTVSEEEIVLAILRLIEMEKGVVEGAGAVGIGAMLGGSLDDLRAKRVVVCLCGGNIDPTVLGRVIEHGLVMDGRLTQFTALITDRPGGLADLTGAIAAAGASVKDISHERAFSTVDVSTVQVACTVETKDAHHIDVLHKMLEDRGVHVIARSHPAACAMR